MKVEIWSDIMCPFCYVGKRHFENALEQLSFANEIDVEWKSFQLDPTLPEKGMSESTKNYLVKRKGMPEVQIEGMFAHLEQVGQQVGIAFKQDISIPVNTFRAHRLVHLAQKDGKGSQMEESLFRAHFTEGKDVGDIEILSGLAAQIGMDKEAVASFLAGDEESLEVQNDIQEAQNLGISGVPFFVIDRKYAISGAQPVETFVDALTEAYEKDKPKFEVKGTSNADACGTEGCEL